jgi:PAH dioxygenase large subunit
MTNVTEKPTTTTKVSREVLWDESVYERELETIFRHSWLFLGHESEIPTAGDYVTRRMGEESVIVTRDESDSVRVFLNSCPHRGNRLCHAGMGNSAHYRCSYHGWTFTNGGVLRGVPRQKELMPESFDRGDYALKEPPHVATYHGMIFASWDPEAMPLEEDFGDFRFYLDALLGATDDGYEVWGPPARRLIRANWKIGAENFAGDSYHLATTHESAIQRGLFGPPEEFFKFNTVSHHINAGNGHVARIEQFPFRPDPPMFFGYPEKTSEEFMRNLNQKQIEMKSGTFIIHGNIFPNLSYMDTVVRFGGEEFSYIWLGLWQPLAAHETEYLNWHLFPKNASPEWKKKAHFAVVNTVGHGGSVAADDTEIVESMVAANRGEAARSQDFIYELGSHIEPESDSSYPGERVYPGVSEANQRYFYEHWDKVVNGGEKTDG